MNILRTPALLLAQLGTGFSPKLENKGAGVRQQRDTTLVAKITAAVSEV
ncbi:hypothetical protein [Paenibacillus planticolens]|nr:hypothetical protein [Paenibacillus planticolens]